MGEEGSVHIPSQQVGVVWPHGRSDGLVISVDLEGNLNYLTPGNPKPVKVVRGHQGNITAVGLAGSDAAPSLVTGSYEGRVRSWDFFKGVASTVDGEGPSNYVSGFSSTSESSGRMYSIGWDDTLRSIDTSAGTFTGISAKASSQPKGVTVTKSGLTVIATASGLEIFSPDGEKAGEKSLGFNSLTSVAASPSSDIVIAGCSNNTAQVYEVSGKSLTLQSTISDASLTSAVSAVAFSPDGSLVALGTAAGRICVFSTADWSLNTSRWSAHTARVTGISWSPDGQFAVSGSLDTNVFVWSVKTPGSRVKALNAHKEGVNGVVWVQKDKVVSVGADAAVKVWKVDGLK